MKGGDTAGPQPQSQVLALDPYRPGMPIQELARKFGLAEDAICKLASNENPLGPSPKALEAARSALINVHRYPDGYQLRSELADRHGLEIDSIMLGNGSNDLLDIIARVYLGPGIESVSSEYAFSVYQLVTQAAGGVNVVVSADNYAHDLDAMAHSITDKTRVLWIANPNNPTGTFASGEALERFLSAVPSTVIVVLDEAYTEYLSNDDAYESVSWLKQHPNLIITRTFSKIYGLAGLRIGYAMANKEIIALLNRVRQPFNANSAAIEAARAALADTQFMTESKALNDAGKAYLIDHLHQMGLEVLPAYGNFVTVGVDDAQRLNAYLLEQGLIVRPLGEYGLTNFIRITCGLKGENERLVGAIQEYIKQKN